MVSQNLVTSRLRLPAFSLVASFLAFIVLVVTSVTLVLSRFPHGLGPMTPQQMATFQGTFVLFNVLTLLPMVLGSGGIVALFSTLKETPARAFAWLMLVTALGAIAATGVIIVTRLGIMGFTQATLGENSTWQWATWFADNVITPLLAVATLATGISLFSSGVLRRTGLVVALLSGIVLILLFVIGAAPFIFGPLWLALGIGLLRRK